MRIEPDEYLFYLFRCWWRLEEPIAVERRPTAVRYALFIAPMVFIVASCAPTAELTIGEPTVAGPTLGFADETGLPVLDATWEGLPPSPLSPRGGAASFVWEDEVFVLAGYTYQPDSFVPPSSCASDSPCGQPVPEPDAADGAAALDTDSGTWRPLAVPQPGGLGGQMTVNGGIAVGFRGDLYDVATDTWTDVPFSDVLVYTRRWWTGHEVVEAGCLYESDGAGTFMAATWVPGAEGWQHHPYPIAGPCPEAAPTLWFDDQLIVFGAAPAHDCPGEGCRSVLTFDPTTGTWTQRSSLVDGNVTPMPGDDRLYLIGHGSISSYDVRTGVVEKLADRPPIDGEIADEAIWTGVALAFLDRDPGTANLWFDVSTREWWRMPPLPDDGDAPTEAAVVVPVGEGEALVWGGHARHDAPSRNASDGYRLRLRRS